MDSAGIGQKRGDYRSDSRLAFRGESEALTEDEQEWQAYRAQRAVRERAERDRLELQQERLERRLARLLAEASAQGFSVADEVLVIEQRLERLERKLRNEAARSTP